MATPTSTASTSTGTDAKARSVLPDAPGRGDEGGDWPAQAADTIVRVVGSVRDRTTGPLLTVARAVVYGLLALLLGLAALVLLAIALVRLVDAYLPGEVWSAHLLIGGAFTLVGLLLWSKRRADPGDR